MIYIEKTDLKKTEIEFEESLQGRVKGSCYSTPTKLHKNGSYQ